MRSWSSTSILTPLVAARGTIVGEVVELVLAGTEELDVAREVGPSAGEDTALVHAQRVGTREVVELLDPYVYSRHHSSGSWVAVFFTKYTIDITPPGLATECQTPPVEHRCHAHISICKCKMSKENLADGVERAKHVVDRLLRKRDRHWRGQALFDISISGNGGEHYSWADILGAVSAAPNFHMSFDSRQKPEPRQKPEADEVRPIAPAEPSRAASSTDA